MEIYFHNIRFYQIIAEVVDVKRKGIENGNWASNRLNEMIILTKYEKLLLDCTKKGNRALAVLTGEFEYLR